MPFGVKASSPCKDQDIRLVPGTAAPDDEVPAAAHSPGFSHGMPAMRKGNGGLLTPVLHLPPWPGSVAGGERQPPRGNFRTFRRETEWHTIFATVWSLWTHMNEFIFRGLRLFGTEMVYAPLLLYPCNTWNYITHHCSNDMGGGGGGHRFGVPFPLILKKIDRGCHKVENSLGK